MSYTPIRFASPDADFTPSCALTDTQLLDYINEALAVLSNVRTDIPGATMHVELKFGPLAPGSGLSFREALRDIHAKTVLDVVTAKLSR